MLSIQGAIQILPESATAEPGKIQSEQGHTNAVVVTFNSTSGPVQIILPTDAVDGIADGLKEAKKKAELDEDIYIPQGGMAEVEQIAKAKEGIEKSGRNN